MASFVQQRTFKFGSIYSPVLNTRNFQNYEFLADRRNELKKHLEENGIKTLIQWNGKGIHQWESLGFTVKLPKVEDFFKKCIMIPIWDYLTDEEVSYIADKITSFYRK